jgi:hypothetical protein
MPRQKADLYLSRTGRRFLATAAEFDRWNNLPYGRWTCADGRVVLFNRFYEPIYQRYPGGPLRDTDPAEWVPYTQQEWFYGDEDPEPAKRRKANAALTMAR